MLDWGNLLPLLPQERGDISDGIFPLMNQAVLSSISRNKLPNTCDIIEVTLFLQRWDIHEAMGFRYAHFGFTPRNAKVIKLMVGECGLFQYLDASISSNEKKVLNTPQSK